MRGGIIEYLKPLKRYLETQLAGLLFLNLILALTSGLLVYELSSALYGILASVFISMTMIVISSRQFTKRALQSTEFLTRALLYVNPNAVNVSAPDSKSLPVSREFFTDLAKNIYDMASKAYSSSTSISDNYKNSALKSQTAILQNMPVAIFAIDKDSLIVYANPAAQEYLSKELNESIKLPFYDSLKLTFDTNQTLESWLKEAKKRVVTDSQYWDRVKITQANGDIRYCDMAVHFNSDNPDGIEVAIALFDHTDKYLNDEHGVGTISMAVHELRTPITVMRGYIEVFEEEVAPKLNEEQAGFMRALSAQAQQLGSFISNVQNFAKIEENAMTLSLKKEDWASIVRGVVNDMKLRAQVRKKSIVAEIPDNLPEVAVDKSTIYEVLVNLIENAIKYTHSAEPVLIKCKVLDSNTIETTITDKGIGIPASLLGNLFERFYRSHRSSASVGGMGLGLYLSKAIVTAHGGEIWVKSKEGVGSTFGFTLNSYNSIEKETNSQDNKSIVRNAHGWIKNHDIYRR